MKAPDTISINKYNTTSDGDVVFAWLENNNFDDDIEYIRKDTLLNWAIAYKESCNISKDDGARFFLNGMEAAMLDLIEKINSL